ncbi:MAG: PfkB family carbohydrate kinase, partial [Phycisphaerae bacterium]
MSLLVTGSIGIDTVEAPAGKVVDALGGSCVYFAYAASFFNHTRIVGVVGDDCPDGFLEPLESNAKVDTLGIEVREGSKTFRWHGKYHEDVNERDTLAVELNVLGERGPSIPESYRDSRYVFLANTHPFLQMELLNQLDGPELVVADTMDLWIETEREGLTALLMQIDGIVLNDSEARLLTQQTNVVAAGLKISELVKKFAVVKKGEHGSILFMDGAAYPLAGYPTRDVIDPTGAGDSFAGAMMGHLAAADAVDIDTLKTAIAYGTVTASFELEDFSLKRFLDLTRLDIDDRM